MSLKPFNLYHNCIPVKGYNRSIIYDLQKGKYHFIPNALFDIIQKYRLDDMPKIKDDFSIEEQEIIEEYHSYLRDLDLINPESDVDCFPPMNLNWENPSIITNSIICLKNEVDYDFQEVINEIDLLGCKAYQLRFFNHIAVSKLKSYLNAFQDTQCQDLQVILPFSSLYTEKVLRILFEENVRLTGMLFHNSPSRYKIIIHEELRLKVDFIKDKFNDHSFCGKINPLNFTQNIPFFTESLSHNNCLNRKLTIDENGYISNCPSLPVKYGHVAENKILEIVSSPRFQKLWEIKKDEIKVCQDCEFRYMCLDCRAYLDSDIKGQPLYCDYNPYLSLWKGQKGYIPVNEYIRLRDNEN